MTHKIPVQCPVCGLRGQVAQDQARKKLRCKRCRNLFAAACAVPRLTPSAAAPTHASAASGTRHRDTALWLVRGALAISIPLTVVAVTAGLAWLGWKVYFWWLPALPEEVVQQQGPGHYGTYDMGLAPFLLLCYEMAVIGGGILILAKLFSSPGIPTDFDSMRPRPTKRLPW